MVARETDLTAARKARADLEAELEGVTGTMRKLQVGARMCRVKGEGMGQRRGIWRWNSRCGAGRLDLW